MTCLEKKKQLESIYTGYGIEVQRHLASLVGAPRRKIIVIAGPTAVGKSSFGLSLAEALNGEIVSADSMQVYRGMDIGTAKPSLREQQAIAHHLIDICDVVESFNVVDFYREALLSIRSIIARNKTPIVVGGSGFYIHCLLYGPPEGPASSHDLRSAIELEMAEFGSEQLYEKLKEYDPVYAATITNNDRHKIVRALEIMALSGVKVSDYRRNQQLKNYEFDIRCWFLHRPRMHLYRDIEARCEKMLESGFLNEVELLIEQGLELNDSASQAIGYRQAIQYLKSDRSQEAYAKFLSAFQQASRRFAKRQFTWFRKEPLFRWLDLDLHDLEVARDMVIQDFNLLS